MRFKVLFIYPNLSMVSMIPQSIAVLSSVLRECEIETDVFDTTFYTTATYDSHDGKIKARLVKPFDFKEKDISRKTTDMFSDLEQKIITFKPDLIAISFVEDTFRLGMNLLEHIRGYDLPVVAGGVFCTYAPEKVAQCEDVDYIVRGEGEYPLKEFCLNMIQGNDIKDIPNLCYKEDGRLIKNNMRPPVNINQVPFADYSIFEEQSLYRPMNGRIYKTVGIETQRGCPFSCAYCNSGANNSLYRQETGKSFFRKKSMGRFAEELEFLVSSVKPELIYFLSDVFLMMTDREFEEFCEAYSGYNIPFFMNTRAETVNEYRIQKLEELNCLRGNVGIEHGNEEFRHEILNRKIKDEEIVRAFKIVGESNFSTAANNIIGFPKETRELIFDTIELNRDVSTDCDSVSCFIFAPYHGTFLRDLAVRERFLNKDTITDTNTFFSSALRMPQLSNEMLKGLQRTFSMYVRFPKSRWNEIELAEKLTPEGERIYERLSQEFQEKFPIG